jgi:hypothetical protein
MTSTTGNSTEDLAKAKWFKSSASGGNGDCLEAAFLDSGRVALRDSEDLNNPPFVVSKSVWEAFLDGARNGEFNLPT